MEIDFKFSLFYKYFCDNTEKKKKKPHKNKQSLRSCLGFCKE